MPWELFAIFLVFSLIFLIVGLTLSGSIHRKQKSCTESVTGTVIKMKAGQNNSAMPVYEYFVSGDRYAKQGSSISHNPLRIGDSVCVMYDPAKPSRAYLRDFDIRIFRILSTIFFVLGAVFLILPLIIALFVLL